MLSSPSLLFIMVLVQPVSGVAEMWNAAPVFPCASQRSRGVVVDANLAALAYSGGGSWGSVVSDCSVLGVVRAKFFLFLAVGVWFAAVLALAHFCHMSLLVALCTGHILPFDLADVLLVWTLSLIHISEPTRLGMIS